MKHLRQLLETERSRRMVAEAAIGMFPSEHSSSGISTRKFPTVLGVEGHALEAAANAARWAHKAIVVASASEPELPSMLINILAHCFMACHMEVQQRLNARVEGMRAFVGNGETVELGAPEGIMAEDTQELLYGELWRRFESIAGVEQEEMVSLAARILSRSLPTEARRELGRRLVNLTWSTFVPLVQSYMSLFVRVSKRMKSFFLGRAKLLFHLMGPGHGPSVVKLWAVQGPPHCTISCVGTPLMLKESCRPTPEDLGKLCPALGPRVFSIPPSSCCVSLS